MAAVSAVLAEKANGSKTDAKNDSSRINFKFAHQFDSGWTGEGVAEWGFSSLTGYEGDLNSTKTVFSNRLGFVGLKHDEVGAFALGKNWAVSYDVNSWTDAMAIRTSASMGIYDGRTGSNGGHVDGSARADDVIQYRNSFWWSERWCSVPVC